MTATCREKGLQPDCLARTKLSEQDGIVDYSIVRDNLTGILQPGDDESC